MQNCVHNFFQDRLNRGFLKGDSCGWENQHKRYHCSKSHLRIALSTVSFFLAPAAVSGVSNTEGGIKGGNIEFWFTVRINASLKTGSNPVPTDLVLMLVRCGYFSYFSSSD